jgi:PAS domain S-box-containing protein
MSEQPLVLNVDDNEAARYAKTRILQRAGYRVVEARSGAEAIESVQRDRPELVLLDVRLPDVSGYEVCRMLKRDYPQLLIIQVSASFVEASDRAHGLDSGADSYLTQPVESAELLATVRALLRLRQAEAAARESNELYRAIVESATDYAILTTDLQGTITTASGGTRPVLGYETGEVVGRSIEGFFTRTDRVADVPAADRERAVKEGRAIGDRWQLRKDGSEFWSTGVLVPLRDGSNRVTGFISILRDRTAEKTHQDWLEREVSARTRALTDANARLMREIEERERAEEALRQAQKVEALGQISGGIAHDFNNMLTVVLGSTEQLKRSLPADAAAQRRRADLVLQAGAQAAALTHRLLSFSRQQPLDAKPTNLDVLVGGLYDLLRSTLGERIELSIVHAESIALVLVDANQVENAIVNLVVNARDAMPEGGKVTITTRSAEGHVALSVADTGVGMPPEVAARAFEPFFTTKRVGHGTGLGLAQVLRLAEQAGGSAAIDSAQGAGTTVTLAFPTMRDSVMPAEGGTASSVQAFSGNGWQALVVEDQAAVREYVSDTLRSLGFEVAAVADGTAALEALRDAAFELMVSDITLPGTIDGWQLAADARSRQPGIRIVLMTGYAPSSTAALGRGTELMLKPFSQAALEVRLHRLFQARDLSD